MQNEGVQQQKTQKKFVEQMIEDVIDGIQKNAMKTYWQASGAHFPNTVVTTDITTPDTVLLRSKIAARVSNVTKAMDSTYPNEDYSHNRCVYRTAHEYGDT